MKKLGVVLFAMMFLFSLGMTQAFAADDEVSAEVKEEIKASDDMPVEADPASVDEPGMPDVPDYSEYFGVVNLWVGYSTLSMGKVNELLDDQNDFYDLLYDVQTTNMSSAFVLGMDIGFLTFKGLPLSLGARLAYIGGFQAKFEATNGFLLAPDYTRTLDVSLIPIMAGATYNINLKGAPIDLAIDAYVGYAIAKAVMTQDSTIDETANLSGGGLAADIGFKANYRISEPLSVGIHFSYRIANISEMTADEAANDAFGLDKGEKLTNPYDSDSVVPFDFSGISIGVNVNMKY